MPCVIAIRREDKNPFERRTPLIPTHVAQLQQEAGIEVCLQPAPRRVFTDSEYLASGASIREAIDDCSVILGVKEIPPAAVAAGQTYVLFSHTIKGQPANMPLLKRLLELGCTLIDYELIVDDAGRRLVFFGRHAGLAGMIDTLWALGRRLDHEGVETALTQVEPCHNYASLAAAKAAIKRVGEQLQLPSGLGPLVVGFTGYGNVSGGAQEILDLMRPVELTPADLLAGRLPDGGLVKVVFHEQHMVEPTRGAGFGLQHYYDHPEAYRPVFARYLDPLTVLVNCIYWEERYPRLVTLDDLARLFAPGASPRLRVIGDISCDINGSIQATSRATEPDNPVYVHDVRTGRAVDGVAGCGPVIMAVDNLPAELPREASESFSAALMPFMKRLARARLDAPAMEDSGLPEVLQRAVIAYRGRLTPAHAQLDALLQR